MKLKSTMLKYIVLLISVLFVSCSSTRSDSDKLPCLNKKHEAFVLRWGQFDAKKESYLGYQLDVYGDLSFYSKANRYDSAKIEFISNPDKQSVCGIIEQTNRTILKTQTLFSPADDMSNFVQLAIPEQSVFILAVWNPKFKTQGSEDYRKLYDSLNLLIPSAKYIKK